MPFTNENTVSDAACTYWRVNWASVSDALSATRHCSTLKWQLTVSASLVPSSSTGTSLSYVCTVRTLTNAHILSRLQKLCLSSCHLAHLVHCALSLVCLIHYNNSAVVRLFNWWRHKWSMTSVRSKVVAPKLHPYAIPYTSVKEESGIKFEVLVKHWMDARECQQRWAVPWVWATFCRPVASTHRNSSASHWQQATFPAIWCLMRTVHPTISLWVSLPLLRMLTCFRRISTIQPSLNRSPHHRLRTLPVQLQPTFLLR